VGYVGVETLCQSSLQSKEGGGLISIVRKSEL